MSALRLWKCDWEARALPMLSPSAGLRSGQVHAKGCLQSPANKVCGSRSEGAVHHHQQTLLDGAAARRLDDSGLGEAEKEHGQGRGDACNGELDASIAVSSGVEDDVEPHRDRTEDDEGEERDEAIPHRVVVRVGHLLAELYDHHVVNELLLVLELSVGVRLQEGVNDGGGVLLFKAVVHILVDHFLALALGVLLQLPRLALALLHDGINLCSRGEVVTKPH
mmetsp:Transcript_3225/g.13238  ORF Transcript_3225/g.13238 Transcript_3225/m.13238 type:complete len:222 (+) Transcript_3225:4426-5091(+)